MFIYSSWAWVESVDNIANIPQSISDQVGLLYAVQNLLYFACLQYTSAAAYQVMSSSAWCDHAAVHFLWNRHPGSECDGKGCIFCLKWALTAHVLVWCKKLSLKWYKHRAGLLLSKPVDSWASHSRHLTSQQLTGPLGLHDLRNGKI